MLFSTGLKEDDIIQSLNESDNEFSDDDETYQPEAEGRISSSDSGSSTESDLEADAELISRTNISRVRTRVQRIRGRILRGRHAVSSRLVSRQPVIRSGPSWADRRFISSSPQQLMQPSYLPPQSFELKFDYFYQYIPEEMFQLITNKTNQTYLAKTGRSLQFNVKECKIYFGATMIMACINYPILRMYWEQKWRIATIADAISRDRFILIRNNIKLIYDDDISPKHRSQDKLWKVRPILDSVKNGCHQQVPDQKVAVDEMMIPFTGNCGMKQYCPNKPNPTGLKVFVLANPDGLILNLKVYQGSTTFPELVDTGFGLGECAVLKLSEVLVPGSVVYHDRYFTTVKLTEELLKKGIKSTGTLMKNRIPAAVRDILITDGELKRKGRGSYQVITRDDDRMAITKWFDNKPVIMLSSIYADNNTDECRRWSKKDKEYVMVKRPEVIKEYNSKMGGVDMADRLLAVCPARTRTRKWTVRFVSHMIDLSITNSWIQFRNNELKNNVPRKRVQQLRFYKMEFGEKLIECNSMPAITELQEENIASIKRPGRPGAIAIPSNMKRRYGALHLPSVLPKQQRCRNEGCNSRSTIFCTFCQVALCLTKDRKCFVSFHSD